MEKGLRKDFIEAVENEDYKKIISFIKSDAVTAEMNYLKSNLTEDLFYNITIELINLNLLTSVFSEDEFQEQFQKYMNYIFTFSNYYLSKIIDIYPNLVLFIAEKSNIFFTLKAFEYDDNIYKIIDRLGKHFGYDKIINELYSNQDRIDKSTSLIGYICKFLSQKPEYITDQVTEEISKMYYLGVSQNQVVVFLKFFNKIHIHYDFYNVFEFYCGHQEICEFILSDNICPENSELEKKIIAECQKYSKHFGLLVDVLPVERLNGKLKEIIVNAKEILKETDKINTSSFNPNFTYNLFKYVYPFLGKKHTLALLKYRSKGLEVILNLCQRGNYEEIKKTLSVWEKLDLLPDEPESIHYLFNHFDTWRRLRDDIIKHNYQLSDKAKHLLITIIKTGNLLIIDTVEKLENQNENIITAQTPRIYGYTNFIDLEKDIQAYKLNDINFLRKIYQIVSFRKDLLLTKEEYAIINIKNRYMQLLERYNQGKSLNLIEELQNIFAKMRKVCAVAMNNELSKINDFSKSMNKEIDDVKIIYLQNESFKFLIHTLKGLDLAFSSYPDLLKRDPSCWNRLEGSTTISTCSISDYYMKTVTEHKGKELSFLFTNISEDSLLYMGCTDVYVTEGGHQLDPSAKGLDFFDLDTLNHFSSIWDTGYNEVVLKRDNLIPDAIASFTKEPTCEEMRAAKYFNVPIISFVMINKERQIKNLSNIKRKVKRKANKDNVIELIYKSRNTLEIMKWLIKEITNQKREDKISNNEYDELLFVLKRESNLFNYNALEKYIKRIIYIRKLAPKGLNYIIEIDDNFENVFLIINGIKYTATYNYSDSEHKKKIAIINTTNKLREHLNISFITGPEFLDPITKCIKLERVYSEKYESLEIKDLYLDSVVVKTLIQEYVLSNFFNNVFDYLSMDYFFYDKAKTIYTQELGYNPAYLLEMKDCAFDDNIYASNNVFGYLARLLEKGKYHEHFDTMLQVAHKIEQIDEQKFLEIFKEYLDFLTQDKENIIQILLTRKRNFVKMVINKIESYTVNNNFSRKRSKD